jgi:transposase InsO family protein
MGWKVNGTMDERVRFTARCLEGEKMADLCREFGISRKTGYKFLERYERHGVTGLADKSRRPLHLARKTSDELERRILHMKGLFPTWGPKKIKWKLETQNPGVQFPAASTIGEILDRNGLVNVRRKRGGLEGYSSTPLTESAESNDVWCADFKGQFKLGNLKYCYPLTITDHFSRYLIGCEALPSTEAKPATALFEEAFETYGLPRAIKSDNGAPFGSKGFMGLSTMSAWWMSLGIAVQKSRPGCPQDNGRHERMHRVLKAETTRPAGANQLQQQERFESFKQSFNCERPHEALAMKTPTQIYAKSKRTLAEAQSAPKYPLHDFTRRVFSNGGLRIDGSSYFIGRALQGHEVGVRELDSGALLVSLGPFDIGFLDPRKKTFTATDPHAPLEEQ